MTILTVLRHAKSSWDDPQLSDFDRPLNARGREAAEAVSRELKHRDIRFDHVLASPALRVRQTIDLLGKAFGKPFEVTFSDALYGAAADALLDFLRSIPEPIHAPLLVGHNPGLQQLVLNLTRGDNRGLRGRVQHKFPTAAAAMIELPAARWAAIEPATGTSSSSSHQQIWLSRRALRKGDRGAG